MFNFFKKIRMITIWLLLFSSGIAIFSAWWQEKEKNKEKDELLEREG